MSDQQTAPPQPPPLAEIVLAPGWLARDIARAEARTPAWMRALVQEGKIG